MMLLKKERCDSLVPFTLRAVTPSGENELIKIFKLGVIGEESFGCAFQVNVLAAGGLVEAVCYLALHLNALLPFESTVSNSREILWFDEHKKIKGVWIYICFCSNVHSVFSLSAGV